MSNIIKKFTVDLGKIDYHNNGKATNRVEIVVQLRKKEGLKNGVLSMVTSVWRRDGKDIVMGGQCHSFLKQNDLQENKRDLFAQMAIVNERWHLNDLRMGNQIQMDALRDSGIYSDGDYKIYSEYLKSKNLLEVNGEKFGHAWYAEELPDSIIDLVNAWSKL